MSRLALLTAVRDHLKAATLSGGLALTQKECELAPREGQPPPRCGERFVGIWAGSRDTFRPVAGLDEFYTVNVTVTMRTHQVPFDLLGPSLYEKASTGFDALVDSVRLCIAKDVLDNRVLTRANTTIGYTGDNTTPLGFYEPLYFLGDNGNSAVGGDWFHADDESVEAGVTCVLRFGRARRTQSFMDGRTYS